MTQTSPSALYAPSLHDALPICPRVCSQPASSRSRVVRVTVGAERPSRVVNSLRERGPKRSKLTTRLGLSRSEEHTSELQSRGHLVCRLLLEKKKTRHKRMIRYV